MASSLINTSNGDSSSSASSTSLAGYWEPHTSSVDFCESNYLLSPHIVEPHNVWSSLLGLSLFGIVGVLYGNPTNEWRTFLMYLILGIIGVGSACLHATLDWKFQSFDELPMIYLVIVDFYAILEVDSPRGRGDRYPNLAKYLVMLGAVDTAVYYAFQHLYVIFLATFSSLTIGVFYFHVQIAWRMHQENQRFKVEGMAKCDNVKYSNNDIALRFYLYHHVSYAMIAAPIWALDMHRCGALLPMYDTLPFPLRGMTLHVVWHICAGMGAHFFVQFLCAARASALGIECGTRFVMGAIPVVVVAKKKDKKT